MAVSCGVGRRHGWDLVWLWLWCGLAAAAPIRPLAWEPPYAAGAALKKKKKGIELESVRSLEASARRGPGPAPVCQEPVCVGSGCWAARDPSPPGSPLGIWSPPYLLEVSHVLGPLGASWGPGGRAMDLAASPAPPAPVPPGGPGSPAET